MTKHSLVFSNNVSSKYAEQCEAMGELGTAPPHEQGFLFVERHKCRAATCQDILPAQGRRGIGSPEPVSVEQLCKV